MFEINYRIEESRARIHKLKTIITRIENFDSKIIKIKHEYLKTRSVDSHDFLSFGNKILRLKSIAIRLVPKCSNLEAEFIAWAALNLDQLFILLYNKHTREIFCNKIGAPLSITHSKYNHCETDLMFDENLWNALKLHSEINSDRILSYITPTLKTGLITSLGNLRVSIQQEPLTVDSPSFVIRRLPTQPVKLQDLIYQNQIMEYHSELLLTLLLDRKNIIIAGEPGSGKTTLANALLYESNVSWRTIVIEDASEIILPKEKFPLLQHYSIPSLDYQKSVLKREVEIIKLLHRSPDYVFLGEIQTQTDTESLFEAFAAGVRGMATTHARSLESLFSRWKDSYKINPALIQSLDAIVITKRKIKENRVKLEVSDVSINIEGKFHKIQTQKINGNMVGG